MNERMKLLKNGLIVIALLMVILLPAGFCNDNGQKSPQLTIGESFFSDFKEEGDPLWTASSGWSNGNMFRVGWMADHVVADKGFLTLTLDNQESCDQPFTSGEYRTEQFYQYGTFEVRMKAAKQKGIISSFFTYTGPYDGQPWDEIDIEFLGRDTTIVQFNYFSNGHGNHEYIDNLGFDASEDFHDYKIVWSKEKIDWYVDGVLKCTATKDIPTHPQRIMMNLWAGTGVDNWLAPFQYTGPLHAVYDWVRYTKEKK
jgi:endo-1,3-1,4-beta-glycanase ExoK